MKLAHMDRILVRTCVCPLVGYGPDDILEEFGVVVEDFEPAADVVVSVCL